MTTLDLLVSIALINGASVFLFWLFIKDYMRQKGKNTALAEDASRISYETEHGKNLATKEDIAELTRIVEDIKRQHAVELETLRSRQQLRLAALDKRLQAHQEAFALWRKLLNSMHGKDMPKAVADCQNWWNDNCLYLEPDAREAFSNAYWAAYNHGSLLDLHRNRPTDVVAEVTENWDKITRAGDIIVASVSLPGLTEGEHKMVDSEPSIPLQLR